MKSVFHYVTNIYIIYTYKQTIMYIFYKINYKIMDFKHLTLEEKTETIKDLMISYNLTTYEINKNTGISIFGLESILKGTTKKPRKATLDKILNYLDSLNKEGTTNLELKEEHTTKFRNKTVAEPPENYDLNFNNLKIDDKLNIIYNQNLAHTKAIEDLQHQLNILHLTTEESLLKAYKNAKQ